MRRTSSLAVTRPIGRGGRLILAGLFLLVAIVIGVAAGGAVYRWQREPIRESAMIGRLLCGPGLRVSDAPSDGRRGIRMVCRDTAGRETGPRNNGIAFLIGLPFVLLVAAPLLLFAWKADIRMRGR